MSIKQRNIDSIFNPKTVAVIGASNNPSKLGFDVLTSLTAGKFIGKVIPVNPGKRKIMGLKSYPTLKDISEEIDLAVIIVSAGLVRNILRECIEKGVKGIVLITGGFKEIEDAAGAELQSEIADLADRAGIPIIGPNTFGILNLKIGLNASFTPQLSQARHGGVSLISQSGGLSHIIGYLSMQNNIGLSKIICLGNRCNVDFAEALEYSMSDSDTKVIAMHLEGTDNPRQLIKVARKHKGIKPLVVYKSARFKRSDQASRSHTGSLAGRNEIYEGSFYQGNILKVTTVEELVDTAKILSISPLPENDRVAIISGQAGPAIGACDVCESMGLKIPLFSKSTQELINEILPPLAIRNNPVDLGPAWNNLESFKSILRVILESSDVAAVLIIIVFGPANRHFIREVSDLLMKSKTPKPIISCFSYPLKIWEKDIRKLEDSCAVVNYPTPERAARALANLWQFKKIRMGLSNTEYKRLKA